MLGFTKALCYRTIVELPALIAGGILLLLGNIAVCSPAEFPPDSVQVRLRTPLTSYSTKPGKVFECVVLSPWAVNDRVLIPERSIIRGHVESSVAVGLGIRHERARLKLVFDDFTTPDGQSFPLHAHLVAVENAREQVTKDGMVRGVLAARQPNEYVLGLWRIPSVRLVELSMVGTMGLGRVINSALQLGPIGAGGILALRLALFRFPEPEIQLPDGADLRLVVDDPNQPGVSQEAQSPLTAPESVADRIAQEPASLAKADDSPVDDIVNLAFLGSRQQLIDAFTAAGWTQPDEHTRKTATKTYFAYSRMRSYAAAPVSAILYKGELPGLVFEKSLNTIAKRHHIRIWSEGMVDGKEIWLGAATHDTGLTFKAHSLRFTHKIDQNLDLERQKVVTDLRFAGCVQPEMRIERPDHASNGLTGGSATDGAVSVLALDTCSEPQQLAADKQPAPGTAMSRLGRRLVLESRNHLLRENFYYFTFNLIRQHYASRASKNAEVAALTSH